MKSCRFHTVAAVLALFLLITGGLSASAQTLETTRVKFGDSVRTIGSLPLYVADAKGFFADEGLDVEVIHFGSGSEASVALLSRAVDIMVDGSSRIMDYALARQPLVGIWSIANLPVYSLWSKPGMTDPRQLEGRAVAISGPGALSHVISQFMLDKVGVDSRRVQFIPIGGPNERLAALLAGQVDAIPGTLDGAPALLEQGFTLILDLADVIDEFVYQVIAAHKDYIEKNPNTVKALLRAISRGAMFINQHPEEAAEILFRVIDYPASQRAAVVEIVRANAHYYPVDGKFALGGFDILNDFLVQQGRVKEPLPYESFIDDRFLVRHLP